ncbi:putative LRR receptor-like serine/threonine-protein kinase [Senna tora]|uniref:Putative LRR receptor-like serine/threonine-protein kinase n=1 Tax=Senna tora TaxID=362788 RepID=A0A834W233_9FABA|nr:putative LRR receptor-like serine/threonine-protein kinase [Senna tora]
MGNNGIMGCLEEERFSLIKLKSSFKNENLLPSWNEQKQRDCCAWEGITCDDNIMMNSTRRVTKILVSHTNSENDERINSSPVSFNASLLLPLKQLQVLDLSNNFTTDMFGVLDDLEKLRFVDFSFNQMERFSVSVGALPSLTTFNLSQNLLSHPQLLQGVICKLKNLQVLDLSINKLSGHLPSCLGNLTSLRALDISDNNLQGNISSTLITSLKFLEYISLSDNHFDGRFPHWLVENNIGLGYLNLKGNNLSGPIELNSTLYCPYMTSFDVSDNDFHGEIPSSIGFIFPGMSSLNMSKNSFRGQIPASVGNMRNLEELDLSRNDFSGQIPDGLISNCTILILLNLENNGLHGQILPSNSNLRALIFLYLDNNHFNGEISQGLLNSRFLKGNKLSGSIPNVLSKAASSLAVLDLMSNQLSSEISSWINSLSNLRILLLKGNRLEGPIPLHICHLKNLTILDLAHNHLFGEVPSCLRNIAFGNDLDGLDLESTNNMIGIATVGFPVQFDSLIDVDHLVKRLEYAPDKQQVLFMTKFRMELYKGITLRLMSGMDLSCNKLTGKIPREIGYLSNIRAMNFSNNALSGPIPESFSNLNQIESLDLSYNNLSGNIPSQLVELYRLSTFSVAYNNLCGSTPLMVNQFATFEKRSYEGNPFLCGPPLDLRCLVPPPPAPAGSDSSSLIEDDGFKEAFLWSSIASFVIAFLGVIAYLYLTYYFSPYNKTLWFWIRPRPRPRRG